MVDVGSGLAQRAEQRRHLRAERITLLVIAVVTAGYALVAWDRRWIADDGLIIVRAVRQILEGNGPVYNAFERAEATTSTLWLWLVAAASAITGREVALVAVGLGGCLAVAGLAIALDATRRFYRARGATTVLVPAGAMVVLGVFPFWDFATSGLETGLCLCWLAAIWWLVGALRPDAGRRTRIFAVVAGLGPLVRPDFALASAVFLAAGWLIARPTWRATLACAGLALAIPLAYEVFRAGYYGTLVPLPALAKSAADADWQRGLKYLLRFVKPHVLYVPLGVLAVAAVAALSTTSARRIGKDAIVLAAPLASAALLAVYVVRVGGDFMHARMMLPPTFLVIAPVLMLPLGRVSVAALVALIGWGVAIVPGFYTGAETVRFDERAGYVAYTQRRNPVSEADYLHRFGHLVEFAAAAVRDRQPVLFTEASERVAISPSHAVPVAAAFGHLGLGGAIVPLDGIAIDTFGLANPLGARITRTKAARPGHEKELPWEWVLADFADPSVTMGSSPARIAAARHAMTCGEIAELLASVRAPLTWSRFWDNLTGAVQRTRLIIPADPIEAERAFCQR